MINPGQNHDDHEVAHDDDNDHHHADDDGDGYVVTWKGDFSCMNDR